MAIEAASTRLHLGLEDDGRALTEEEYRDASYEEPWRYELVDGRLSVMSPNSAEHDDTSEPFRDQLVLYKVAHPDRVEKVISEAWVRIGQGRYRIGDIGVFLRSDRAATPRPERVPELMFEVVSPGATSGRRDYVEKRADYDRAGVLEYVVIDYEESRVTVLSHAPGGYQENVLTETGVYTTPLLPGLAVPLAEVFGG